MRVLHLTRDLTPRSVGGISTVVGGLLDECTHNGMTSHAISFDAWRPQAHATTSGSAVHTRGLLRVDGPAALPEVFAFAREVACAVVHVHHESLWRFGHSIARECGAGTVYTSHVLQWELNRVRGVSATRSSAEQLEAIAEADVVTAPSRYAAALVRGATGREALVTYPGVSGEWLRIGDRPSTHSRPRIVSVGRWDVAKGTARVLEAARAVAETVGELTLTMVGDVPENARAAQRWRDTFALHESSSLRVDAPGWLRSEALRATLDDASVYLQLSASETFGVATVEALARGVPTVCTDTGVVPELSADALIRVPCDTPRAASDAVAGLLLDAGRRSALGAAARREAQRFSWTNVLPGWIAAWKAATP